MSTVYHPDPEINAEVAAEELAAERLDLSIGYPPRRWLCPDCGHGHSRGHFAMTVGIHRCLFCGYVGPDGVMTLDGPERACPAAHDSEEDSR